MSSQAFYVYHVCIISNILDRKAADTLIKRFEGFLNIFYLNYFVSLHLITIALVYVRFETINSKKPNRTNAESVVSTLIDIILPIYLNARIL